MCAMKTDLREHTKDSITKDMGQKLAKQIGAIGYSEVRYVPFYHLRVVLVED